MGDRPPVAYILTWTDLRINLMRWVASYHSILFYVFSHHGSCTNGSITANVHILHQAHLRPYVDIIAYNGCPHLICAYRKELANVHIVAYHRRVINDNA